MNQDILSLRLQETWQGCERHVHHLFYAISTINNFSPLNVEIYRQLSDEQIRAIDQFILRFSKLQDTMGNRLFPLILQYLGESFENRPMIDKLNRLEKLGFIQQTEQWHLLRNIRNQFTHDYPNDPDKNVAQLNIAFQAANDLYTMLTVVGDKLNTEYPQLNCRRILP